MKKWLKENWFKLSILIPLLVIAVLIVNYLHGYLEEKKEFDRQVICADQVNDLRKKIPEVRRDYELLDSNYNVQSGICYAYILDAEDSWYLHIVYDAFRGTEVFNASMLIRGDIVKFYGKDVSSDEDIDKKARQIMYSSDE